LRKISDRALGARGREGEVRRMYTTVSRAFSCPSVLPPDWFQGARTAFSSQVDTAATLMVHELHIAERIWNCGAITERDLRPDSRDSISGTSDSPVFRIDLETGLAARSRDDRNRARSPPGQVTRESVVRTRQDSVSTQIVGPAAGIDEDCVSVKALRLRGKIPKCQPPGLSATSRHFRAPTGSS